jgi:hypothetical protein
MKPKIAKNRYLILDTRTLLAGGFFTWNKRQLGCKWPALETVAGLSHLERDKYTSIEYFENTTRNGKDFALEMLDRVHAVISPNV